MKPITFDELDVEIIRQEPLWASFLDALAEFYNTQIRPDIGQLEDIRNLKANTAPEFVELTLKNMGIDIPFDMIVNKERLYNSVYMIPLLYQTSGIDAAYQAIAFILGRRVKVTPLYTENYAEFYPKPYGPLRIDGGTWYKTTHILLEMQTVATDADLFIPRGQTLKDRLLDAFYNFAPYNIVVEQFYTNIEAVLGPDPAEYGPTDPSIDPSKPIDPDDSDSDPDPSPDPSPDPDPEVKTNFGIGLWGEIQRHFVRRIEVNEQYYGTRQYKIVGPDQVTSLEPVEFYVVANNTPIFVDNWSCDIASIINGQVTFPAYEEDQVATIVVEVDGRTYTKEVHVFMNLRGVQLLEIVGPSSIKSGTSAYYELLAHHEGGPTTVHKQIEVNSQYGRMVGSYLVTEEVEENQQVGLYCDVVLNNVNYHAAKLVTLSRVNTDVELIDFKVTGPQDLLENRTYSYNATAYFSDGSQELVTAKWESDSSSAHIENGDMATGMVDSDTQFEARAKYTFRQKTLESKIDLTLKRTDLTITGIEIIGPASVYSESVSQYTCVVQYADGSSTSIVPDWTASQFSINEDGVFFAGLVRGSLMCEISATHRGVTAKKTVVIEEAPVVLKALEIIGPDSLSEGDLGTFICHAIYSDGKRRVVPDWTLPGTGDWATIVAGDLLFYNPEADILTVQAEFGGMTQTHTVVCIAIKNNVSNLMISGPATVNALDRILLTATVQFEDGSYAQVDPIWTVTTTDTNADFIAADIEDGVVTGRGVDNDMEVTVRARYFQHEAEWPITVKYVMSTSPDKPVRSRIIGPPVFYADQIASFAQAIVFEAHPDVELLVSSDWSIVENLTNVRIDENGFVTMSGVNNQNFTIRAVYSCRGTVVENTLTVTGLAAQTGINDFTITGDDYLEVGEVTTLGATLFTDNHPSGTLVSANWYALSDTQNIQINDGMVRVVGPVVNQVLTVAASYNDLIEASHTIRIGKSAPIYYKGTATDMDSVFANGREITGNQVIDTFVGEGFIAYPTVFGTATILQDGQPDQWGAAQLVTREINGVVTHWYVHQAKTPNMGQVTLTITYS